MTATPHIIDFAPRESLRYSIKTYRRHNCPRQHRSYYTLAKCMIKSAVWVTGEGEYALISWCGGIPTVRLWPALHDARARKKWLDRVGCGGGCVEDHEVVRLVH